MSEVIVHCIEEFLGREIAYRSSGAIGSAPREVVLLVREGGREYRGFGGEEIRTDIVQSGTGPIDPTVFGFSGSLTIISITP